MRSNLYAKSVLKFLTSYSPMPKKSCGAHASEQMSLITPLKVVMIVMKSLSTLAESNMKLL